jgi:Tol biopolymer transport system component
MVRPRRGAMLVLIAGCVPGCGGERSALPGPLVADAQVTGAEATARRIWMGPAVELSGTPSHDGRLLSFVDWGTGDLAMFDTETGAHRRVTDKGSWEESGEYAQSSVFSPDGRRLAYAWFRPHAEHTIHYEIRVIDVAGSEPRTIYSNPGTVAFMVLHDWSRDGAWILAVLYGADKNKQLALVSASTGAVRVLKSLGWRSPLKAAFSPDARYVAYDLPVDAPASPRQILVLATDGSSERRLVDDPADDRLHAWSAAGVVVFQSMRSGRPAIWSVPVERDRARGAPRLLRSDMWALLALGEGGGRLLYGVLLESPEVVTTTVDVERGRVALEPAPLPHPAGEIHGASDWSPDGRAIAYTMTRHGQQTGLTAVVVRATDGESEPREMTIEFERVRHIRWAPDGGSLLLVGAGPHGRGGIYRLDLADARVHRLAYAPPGAVYAQWPEWSADGRTVHFLRRHARRGQNGLVALDVATGRETVVTLMPQATAVARSPDGAACAVVVEEPGDRARLNVTACDGSAGRTLVQFTGPAPPVHHFNYRAGVRWTRDGSHILYSTADVQGNAAVWSVDVATGEAVKLFDDANVWDLRLHPDGRRLAFTRDRRRAEVWSLDLELGRE